MTARRSRGRSRIILLIAAAILLAMGRPPICTCGTVDLWVGAGDSSKTSQMLSDWYSASHIVHGLLFYAALWLVARRWPVEWRFLAALCIEAAWEVTENTPMVIDRYREDDGSTRLHRRQRPQFHVRHCDDGLGFLLARKLPVWAAVLADRCSNWCRCSSSATI